MMPLRRPRAAATAALAAIVAALAGTPARADVKLCNRMSYVVDVAIGLDDRGTTATSGWFRLDPAQCRIALQGDVSGKVLLHARTLPVYGAQPAQAGTERLCITSDNFTIAAARQCRGAQTLAPFTEIRPSQAEDGMQVAYLAEDSEYDDEQARLAGIQRLLVIAGYDAAPIDGVDGPKTQGALSAFLRAHNLSAESVAGPDFFATMLKAVQSPSMNGFAWCNDTPYKVMAAIATDDGKTITSRGWYGVAAGTCLHPDISGQPRRIFSFAEAVDAGGQAMAVGGKPLSWGGPMRLCTREAKFEITEHDDCAARGLTGAGFAQVGAGGKTLRFALP